MNYYARFWNKKKLSPGSEKIVSGLRRNCLWELIVAGQWTLWWLVLCVKRPGLWAAQMFSLTLFWVFGDVINIQIYRLSKAGCHPQCEWASSNQWKVWIEQKGWVRRNFSSDPLRWTAVCSCLWACTGIYTVCSLGFSACWLQILRPFFSFHSHMCQLSVINLFISLWRILTNPDTKRCTYWIII